MVSVLVVELVVMTDRDGGGDDDGASGNSDGT